MAVEMVVDIGCGFGEFPLDERLQPSKRGNGVGQQVDANEDGKEALAGRDDHDDSGHDAKPSGGVFQDPLGVLVKGQMLHVAAPFKRTKPRSL